MKNDLQESWHSASSWMSRFEKYLPEVVYDSMDGIVTKFAVVAGSVGADLAINIILILGVSNRSGNRFLLSL